MKIKIRVALAVLALVFAAFALVQLAPASVEAGGSCEADCENQLHRCLQSSEPPSACEDAFQACLQSCS